MQLDSVKAATLAVVRSVGALRNYVMTKRCWQCRRVLRKRAMVCPHCRKWQA